MDKLILSSIEVTDLLSGLRSMIREELSAFREKETSEKFLSPSETCKLFQPQITRPTLKAWAQTGKLKEYRIGSRLFFKYSEVLEAVTKIKRYERK